jgi:DNA-binding response OmpR family regulator
MLGIGETFMTTDEQRCSSLSGCRVLVLEDEYFLAADLKKALSAAGAEVIGPIADFDSAHNQAAEGGFDVAIIDINLFDRATYSIADALQRAKVPFVFATGYSREAIPVRFHDVVCWEKPYDLPKLVEDVERLCSLCDA